MQCLAACSPGAGTPCPSEASILRHSLISSPELLLMHVHHATYWLHALAQRVLK